jgi:hypothetical protein
LGHRNYPEGFAVTEAAAKEHEEHIVKTLLGPALFKIYRDIAVREQSSIVAVVRDILRKNAEGQG